MSCCNNFLGTFPHNESVNTGITAAKTGIYKYLLQFNGAIITKEQSVPSLSGDPKLIIPMPMNENFMYRFTILDPDGDLVSLNACTFFSFRTYVNISVSCETECSYT